MRGSSIGPGAVGGIQVKGLRELNRAFARADKDSKKFVREAEREIGRPVQLAVQRLAVTKISGLARQNETGMAKWALMRIGVTRKLIYVAPEQRGRQSRHNAMRRRPNLKVLLLMRAMDPAWAENRVLSERKFEHALDILADRFNH